MYFQIQKYATSDVFSGNNRYSTLCNYPIITENVRLLFLLGLVLKCPVFTK